MKKLLCVITILLLITTTLPAQDGRDYLEQGLAHYKAENLDAAIESLETAKKLEPGIRTIWRELGNVYLDKGSYDAAIENFDQAIEISRKIGMEEHNAYARRGEAYFYKGNYNAAAEDYSQAIRLDAENSLYWNNRGEIYRSMGEYSLALADFSNAIKINEKYTNALNNLGFVYYNMKDLDETNLDKAIENFTRVIEIDSRHAEAWNNRGSAYLEKGDYDKAIADFTQVIRFNPNFAVVYSNRSRAYLSKKDNQKALADCSRALEIDKDFMPALNNRARVYQEMGDYQRALEDYRKCLDAAGRSININDISVYAWYLAGQVYNKYPYLKGEIKTHDFWSEFAGNLALEGIGIGIRNAETIRKNMGTQGADLMAQMIYLYYAGVDFEINFGSKEKSFLYSESLRSRGFLEQIGKEAAIRLPQVSEEERTQFRAIRAIIEKQQAVINTYDRTKLEGEANARYAAAILERKKAEDDQAELDNKIGSRIKKYNQLRNPQPVSLKEAMAFCGEDRVVLEYVLWDSSGYMPIKGYESWELTGPPPGINSYCLIITKDGLTPVLLKNDFDYSGMTENLRSKIFHLDEEKKLSLLEESAFETERNDLYRALIEPVLRYIPKNIQNIVIVPDGTLAFLPFDILRENAGTKDFGEKFQISLSPSVSVSILASHITENKRYEPFLGFGGALYDNNYGFDENGKSLFWKRLWFSEGEVNTISRRFSQNPVVYLGRDVSKANIKKMSAGGTLSKYAVIHFACHSFFNQQEPAKSGLLLSEISGQINTGEDGNLNIEDAALLNLQAQMVLLSACSTGMGEIKRGDGIVGLARSFIVAGTRSVGVSLWEIEDRRTMIFMTTLYRFLKQDGRGFKEAYFLTKNDFRKGRNKHPFYWAAFIMYE